MPEVDRIARATGALADSYNGFVSARKPSLRCPGFKLWVKCDSDSLSLTIATPWHSESWPAHGRGLELEINQSAIVTLSMHRAKSSHFEV
jgi:hypothetical protein